MYPGGTWFDPPRAGLLCGTISCATCCPPLRSTASRTPPHARSAVDGDVGAVARAVFHPAVAVCGIEGAAQDHKNRGLHRRGRLRARRTRTGRCVSGLACNSNLRRGPPCLSLLSRAPRSFGFQRARGTNGSPSDSPARSQWCQRLRHTPPPPPNPPNHPLPPSSTHFGIYGHHMAAHTAPFHLLPALQKVALAILWVWMVVVATIERPRGPQMPAQSGRH